MSAVSKAFAVKQVARLPGQHYLSPEQRADLADVLARLPSEDQARRVVDAWVDGQSTTPTRAELLNLARAMRSGGEWRPSDSRCSTCHGTGYEPYVVITTQTSYASGAAYTDKQEVTVEDMRRVTGEPSGPLAMMIYWRDLRIGPSQRAYEFARPCQCLPRGSQ